MGAVGAVGGVRAEAAGGVVRELEFECRPINQLNQDKVMTKQKEMEKMVWLEI